MAVMQIQKRNVIREVDERELREWEEKGYKKVETTQRNDSSDLFAPDFDSMSDEEIAKYAAENGKDISKAKDRAQAIKMLSK